MQSVVVIDPPVPILGLAEAKAHLRVDDDADDALIGSLIAAATAHIDGPAGWLGRALGRQTLELRRCGFPDCGWIALPCRPIHAIVQVAYDDPAEAPRTFDPASCGLYDRTLMPAPGLSWPAAASRPESLRIRYTAGYEGGQVPAPILAAVKLMVGDLYRHRETAAIGTLSSVPMNTTVAALLAPFQVWEL